jgi:PilZ domain-containing protein
MNAVSFHPLVSSELLPQGRRDRTTTDLPGFAIREDGSSVDVTLIDLSYDGCGIDCSLPLRPGETVRLAVHRGQAIAATVRWSADGKAGLKFVNPGGAAEQRPRQHERVAVSAEINMRRAGKLHFRVRIFDMSPEGCKAEFIDRPEVQEQLWVKFDGVESLEAQVCWVADSKVGIRFSRPIHPAVFDLLVQRMR